MKYMAIMLSSLSQVDDLEKALNDGWRVKDEYFGNTDGSNAAVLVLFKEEETDLCNLAYR